MMCLACPQNQEEQFLLLVLFFILFELYTFEDNSPKLIENIEEEASSKIYGKIQKCIAVIDADTTTFKFVWQLVENTMMIKFE